MGPGRLLLLPSSGRGNVFLTKLSSSSSLPLEYQRSLCFHTASQNLGFRTNYLCRRSFPASSSLMHSLPPLTAQRENRVHQQQQQQQQQEQQLRKYSSGSFYGFGCVPLVAASSSAAAASPSSAVAAATAGRRTQQQQRRNMSSHEEYPPELTRGTRGCMDMPVGGEGLYRRGGNIGMPMLFVMQYDRPTWQPLWEDEHEQIPRDGFGVPAHIPPEVSQYIKHVYHVPPQFYHFLKKLGDDTPALQPYVHKLINGDFTHDDYEEMFYKFAKPLKIYRKQIPMPYRTQEEVTRQDEVAWEGAWLSYRQHVLASYNSAMYLRELLFGGLVGIYFAWVFLDGHRQYRLDMKLFYLEAPEHKVNWVKPRGDLV